MEVYLFTFKLSNTAEGTALQIPAMHEMLISNTANVLFHSEICII